jgi:hypothetical protein
MMGTKIAAGVIVALALAVSPAIAAPKGAGKAPPACAAIYFRPLPPGMTDGDHQAGMYRSRLARLEVYGEVKQGNPVDYYVMAGGKRIGGAPADLPEAAVSCAAAKKMPKPEAAASSCTGQRFSVVIAHAGDQRLALLYGEDGGSWHFCSAGPF